MQILLISANRERMPFPVAPLGLAYIAGTLKREGYTVRVVDLCFSSDIQADLTQILEDFHPHLIGISLRNLDNSEHPRPPHRNPPSGHSLTTYFLHILPRTWSQAMVYIC